MASSHDRLLIQQFADEPLYCSAPQHPDDIVCEGSDSEETPAQTKIKRLRYEEAAQRYLNGEVPTLQSASLKGPFERETGWVNPWRHKARAVPVWWEPESDDMLFTRRNVLQWARDCGLGYLDPVQALARCKAQANAEREAIEEIEMDMARDFNQFPQGSSRSAYANRGSDSRSSYQSSKNRSVEELEDEAYVETKQEPEIATKSHLFAKDPAPFLHSIHHSDSSLLPGNATRVMKRTVDAQWLKTKPSKRSRWEDAPPTATPTPIHKLSVTSHKRPKGPPKSGVSNTNNQAKASLDVANATFSKQTSNAAKKSQGRPHIQTPLDSYNDDADSEASIKYISTLPIEHSQISNTGQKRKRVSGLAHAQAMWEALQPKDNQQVQPQRNTSDTKTLVSDQIISDNMATSSKKSSREALSAMEEKRAYLFHDPVVIDLESEDERDSPNPDTRIDKGVPQASSSDKKSKHQVGDEPMEKKLLKTPGLDTSQSSFVTEVAPSTRGLGTFHFRKRRKPTEEEHTIISLEDSVEPSMPVSGSQRQHNTKDQGQVLTKESSGLSFRERQRSLSIGSDLRVGLPPLPYLALQSLESEEIFTESKKQAHEGGRDSKQLEGASPKSVNSHLESEYDFTDRADTQFRTPTTTPKIPTPKLPTPFGFETSFGIDMFETTSTHAHPTQKLDAPSGSVIPQRSPAFEGATSRKSSSIQQAFEQSSPSKSALVHPSPHKSSNKRPSQSSAHTKYDHDTAAIAKEKILANKAGSRESLSSLTKISTGPTSFEKAGKSKLPSQKDSPASEHSSTSWEVVEDVGQNPERSHPMSVRYGQTSDSSLDRVSKVVDKIAELSSPPAPGTFESPQVISVSSQPPSTRAHDSGKAVSSPASVVSPHKTQESPRIDRLPRQRETVQIVDELDFSTQSFDSANATSPIKRSPYQHAQTEKTNDAATQHRNTSSPSSIRKQSTKSLGSPLSSPGSKSKLGSTQRHLHTNLSTPDKATHASQDGSATGEGHKRISINAQSPFQQQHVIEIDSASDLSDSNNIAEHDDPQILDDEPASNEEPQSPWMDENTENIQIGTSANVNNSLMDASSHQTEDSSKHDDTTNHDWQQIDEPAILDGDLSEMLRISTPVRQSQEQQKVTPKTSPPHSTQLLYDESNNPWKGNLKTPKSGKSKKRVSFGVLLTSEAGDSQGSLPRLRSSSPPIPSKLLQMEDSYMDAEGENHHLTRENTIANKVKVPSGKYQPKASEKKYRITGSPCKRSSPPVDAMAKAFIAAEREGTPESFVGLKESLDSNQQVTPNPGGKAYHNSWGLDSESQLDSFSISPAGKLTKTTSHDENLADMIEDVEAFLDGWSVEADLQKASEANGSQKERSRSSTKRGRYSGFSSGWS